MYFFFVIRKLKFQKKATFFSVSLDSLTLFIDSFPTVCWLSYENEVGSLCFLHSDWLHLSYYDICLQNFVL